MNKEKILHQLIRDLERRSSQSAKQKEICMAVKRKAKAKAKKPVKKTKKKSGLTQLEYNLSPELAEIVGMKKTTRPQVVKKIWVYIKAKKLQDSKNKRMINPDKKLSEVLGNRSIDMLKMAGAISKHLKKA